VPNPVNPPQGCRLHPRCPVARAECGWSIDDVLTDAERNTPVVFETISRVERSSDFRATVSFSEPEQAKKFAKRIGSLAAHEALEQPIRLDDKLVEVSFNEVSEAQLQQLKDGRWSSCTRTQNLGALPEL